MMFPTGRPLMVETLAQYVFARVLFLKHLLPAPVPIIEGLTANA